MTEAEWVQELLKQHNLIRTQPKSFIPDMEELITKFNGGKSLSISSKELRDGFTYTVTRTYNTCEGDAPIRELIDYLNSAEALPELSLDTSIAQKIACAHVDDQGKTTQTGNSSTDGTLFDGRIKELKATCRAIGENLYYGAGTPRDALINMIASDCDPNRTKRKEVFNTNYSQMGACRGDHGN